MELFKTLSIASLMFLLVACRSNNTPQKMDRFVIKTELQCDGYNPSDWQNSLLEFENLVEEFYTSGKEYSETEKQMAAEAIGRYHSLLIKNGVEQSATYLQNLKSIIPSYLEGLIDGINDNTDDLKKNLNEVLDNEELEQTLSSFSNKIDKILDKIINE